MSHPAHGRRRWWRASPIVFRRAALGVAAFLLLISFVSSRFSLSGWLAAGGACWSAELAHATLTVTWHADEDSMREPPGRVARLGALGMYVYRLWGDEINLAWRPYHVATGRLPKRSSHHGVALPLWPLLLGSMALAGYAHGLVVGAGRETIGRCRRCGYDVRALPAGAACPECGEATGVRGQSPVVVSIDARSDLKSLTKSGS